MKITVDPVKLERSICRDSYSDFVRRFWSVAIPEKMVWNWHIDVMCDALQDVAMRVIRGEPKKYDLLTNVPPATTKSTVHSVLFQPWVWTMMPTARFICSSYAHDLSLDLSRRSRMVLQSEKYKELFGEIQLREDQNAKHHYVNQYGGGRYSTSTDGTVTGFHGHFIMVDDPLNPERAASEAELKTANRYVSQTLSSRYVDKDTCVMVMVMQRLHQDDPSAAMLARAKKGNPIRHICLPAEIEGDGLDDVKPRKYAANYVGGLLDPRRLSTTALRAARISLGDYGYAGQFLQRPVPPGGGMFKVDRLSIETASSNPLAWRRRVRFWDKAGTKDGGAFTAGVLVGQDTRGRFWVLNVIRGQWDSGDRERIIKQTAQADGRGVEVGVEQEPGSGGKESAESTVRNLAGFRVRVVRPTGDKVLRADPFSSQVNMGNVLLAVGDWNSTFIEEYRYFPHSTFKDQVDAGSGAFSVLTRVIRVGGLSASKT